MSADVSKKISLALGGAKKPPKPAATNGIKRSHAALHDYEDEESGHGKLEKVSHFDRSAGGAIDESRRPREEKLLVIAPRANRDWKEASQRNKRQRSQKLPGANKEAVNGEGHYEEKAKPEFGLIVSKRAQQNGESATDGEAPATTGEHTKTAPSEPNGDVVMQEKTEDERAIEALIGGEQKSELVLPAMTEEEAFERDYKDAPDMATLEVYERVPVEQFGAALLRGMGWKEGEGIGSQRGKKVEKVNVPQRRPALLGIGAKEEAAVAQELGTWGKAAKDRKGPVQVYNPVLLRDKKTGEMFTEEELEKRKQQQEREKYERQFEEQEMQKAKERRRKDRDDSRDRDSDRRDRRKERSNDRGRQKYDSDEEYYRRKEKEKRHRERDRTDSDRDPSRRHDSDREKHRERHRDHRR